MRVTIATRKWKANIKPTSLYIQRGSSKRDLDRKKTNQGYKEKNREHGSEIKEEEGGAMKSRVGGKSMGKATAEPSDELLSTRRSKGPVLMNFA